MSKTTIGSASLNLAADDRKLSEGLKRASANIKGFKSQFSSFSSGFSSLATGIGAGIAGLGALRLGTNLVGDMISAASAVEDLTIGFEVMLGSATEAEKLYGKIKKLADDTPFETADLANAASHLVNVGVSADDVVGTLSALGDVAGGSAEKLKSLALIYGKVIEDQKVTGETLTQLAENQISLNSNLAKVLGVNVTQVKLLGSQGKISLQDFQKAINNATAEGGRFYGFMEKRSKTFSGLISTLKGNWEGLLASVGKIFIEEFNLKGEVAKISAMFDAASKNAETLRPLFRVIAPGFREMANSAFDMAMGFAIAAATLADMVKDANTMAVAVGATVKGALNIPGTEIKTDPDSQAAKIKKFFDGLKKMGEDALKAIDLGSDSTFLTRIFKAGKAEAAAEARRAGDFLGKVYADAVAAAKNGKIREWKAALSAKDIEQLGGLRDEFDPVGKAKRDMDELRRLQKLGGFDGMQGRPDEGVFARAMQKITDELTALAPRLELKTEAAVRDSVEAATAIIDNANRAKFDKPQDKLLNAMIQLKQIAERQEREAKRIVDAIERKQIPGLF